MKLKQIMSADLQSCGSDATLSEAAEIMRAANVGCLPVVDGGRLCGIVTDRDLAVRGLTRSSDAGSLPVGEVMTLNPLTLRPDARVCDAVALMRTQRIRRVPIVDDEGALIGMVTLTDVALRAHEPIQSGTALLSICAQPAVS